MLRTNSAEGVSGSRTRLSAFGSPRSDTTKSAAFRRGLSSVLNGFGNIYQVDMSAILR